MKMKKRFFSSDRLKKLTTAELAAYRIIHNHETQMAGKLLERRLRK